MTSSNDELPSSSSLSSSSLTFRTCDTVTQQLITVLLTISEWTAAWAAGLRTQNADRCDSVASIFGGGTMIRESMSSVVTKQALIIALGGASIAALFVWYIQTKREEERKRKKSNALNGEVKRENETAQAGSGSAATVPPPATAGGKNGSAKKTKRNKRLSESGKAEEAEEQKVVEEEKAKKVEEQKLVDAPKAEIQEEEEAEKLEIEKPQNLEEEKKANVEEEVKEEEQKKEEEAKEEEVEEVVQKVEVKQVQAAAAPIQPLQMPLLKKRSDSDQIPEEPTPTKTLTQPLKVDICPAQLSSPSWSEEMENCKEFEHSDSENVQMSPTKMLKTNKTNGRNQRKGGAKGQNQQQTAAAGRGENKKTTARRLNNKEQQQKETNEFEKENQHKGKGSAAFEQDDSCHNVTVNNKEHENGGDDVYEKSDSPGLDSQNSEASSQDSGRATGGLASSLSPLDENGQGIHDEFGELLPMYEFEIPNSLVGLVIGVKGKTIKELSLRTSVRMLIRQHHTPEKVKTHQICQVRGKRDEINHCLQMLRRRFPSPRFPELNLQPVLPPPIPSNNFDMLSTQPTWLTLPEEIRCEIAVSSIIDPSHFFVQQPTHPSFASLRYLDLYMLQLYGEHSNLPEMPVPCQNGLLCAAPVGNAWFRAVTVQYYDETDEVFVKFVDYGGYSKMSRQDLRQIRTDLMSLPFQSTEVMLAHCRPVDGTANWTEQAMHEFSQLCTGKVITCKLVGYAAETRIPMIELFVTMKDVNGEDKEWRFDQYLMEKGLARTADPSKLVRPGKLPTQQTQQQQNGTKRPSLASQTSQTTVVC